MNQVVFRQARREDLPEIVRMLANDDLGSQRENVENPLPESYYAALEQINCDLNHQLIAAELDGKVIGTLHLIFLPTIRADCALRSSLCA